MAGVSLVALACTSPGQSFVVGLFNESIRGAAGLDENTLALAYMIGTLASASLMTLAGKLSDKLGPRTMMGLSALGLAGACTAVGYVQGVVSVTVAFFLLRFFGQGVLGLSASHMTAMWFERRLARVESYKQLGLAGLWIGLPAVVLWLIESFGWSRAYATLGFAAAVIVVPLAIFVARNRPEDVGLTVDGDDEHTDDTNANTSEQTSPAIEHKGPDFTLSEAIMTRAFWVVQLTMVLNGVVGTAFLFNMQPMLTERGFDADIAAIALPAWNITMAVSTLIGGQVADRVRPRFLLAGSCGVLATASIVAAFASQPWHFPLFMAMFGLSQSLAVVAGSPAIARFFGRSHHGSIRGFGSTASIAGTAVGPIIHTQLVAVAPALVWLVGEGRGLSIGPLLAAAVAIPLGVLATTLRPPRHPSLGPAGS
ncbi:MAG: MFS transporter [Planctomycetota bacterium]